MNYLHALLLSIVEGISEFLPISSTGHLILTSTILGIPQTEFVKSFEIIIQLGAILAIPVLYGKKFLTRRKIWLPVIAAFLPTAVVGLVLYKLIKSYLIGNNWVTIITLFLGGIIIIILEKLYQAKPHHLNSIENIPLPKAVLIGLIQSISVIPGVSRAGATIFGGMFLGLTRSAATEFSFFLAIPTVAAAAGLDLVKSSWQFTPYEFSLLGLGLLGSFFSAILVVSFFLGYIKHHTFIPFGIYRILLAIVFWLALLK